MNEKKTLGILGGMGPAATAYFFQMITEHTKAVRDCEHLNIIVSCRPDTPDRTDYLTGRGRRSPVGYLRGEVRKLVFCGANIIAIPCNTAHCFYKDVTAVSRRAVVLNMIDECAEFLRFHEIGRVGVLATEGTVDSGLYKNAIERVGTAYKTCSRQLQARINDLIYKEIKAGKAPNTEALKCVAEELFNDGCERVLLGCTELSVMKKNGSLDDDRYIDPLEILACRAITECGGEILGFSDDIKKCIYETGDK